MWMMKKPSFWFEMIIMIIIPFPSTNSDSIFGSKIIYMECINWMDSSSDYPAGSHIYNTPYFSNDFFLACMFLRFYYVLQLLVVVSPPNDKLVGKRICHEQGIDPTFTFQMKTAFKNRPYLLFLVTFFWSVLAFASLIRIFERPYYEVNFKDNDYHYFQSYASAIWYIMITMTSVGYGNIVAVTPVGRLVTLFVAFWGAI